ncbi:hypothetical protein Tco_0452699 [Tanacetum coccineum]
MPTEMELTLEQTQQGVSYEVSVFTMKMEILLEPTSNKLMVEHAEYDESNTYVLERLNTTAGNPVKKILLKLNLSDHRILKDGDEDATLKLSKSTNQERYEHVGPEVTSPQDGKISRWQRDYAWSMISKLLKITMSNTSSRNKLNPEINDHYNIFTRESQEYELKTKDEA